MSLTVVGSIAFDSVRTPFAARERMLGGAAVHFALAASLLADEVRVVGPVGDDFGEGELAVLRERGVLTDGIERIAGGRTFFWAGEYGFDLNSRETLATELGVFETFSPKLSPAAAGADVVFLANIQPDVQRAVREQCAGARFVAMDSMDLWIEVARDALIATIRGVDGLLLNDAELRQLTGEPSILGAARAVLALGPRVVVAKHGEFGASMHTDDEEPFFALPAYPLERVVDPTGAGDSFAGGFMGYVAAHPGAALDGPFLRRAMAHGTALASFNVEELGTDRVRRLRRGEVDERVDDLARLTALAPAPVARD